MFWDDELVRIMLLGLNSAGFSQTMVPSLPMLAREPFILNEDKLK